MGFLSDFLSWVWARHPNVLSWYLRPMFILPFILLCLQVQLVGTRHHDVLL